MLTSLTSNYIILGLGDVTPGNPEYMIAMFGYSSIFEFNLIQVNV